MRTLTTLTRALIAGLCGLLILTTAPSVAYADDTISGSVGGEGTGGSTSGGDGHTGPTPGGSSTPDPYGYYSVTVATPNIGGYCAATENNGELQQAWVVYRYLKTEHTLEEVQQIVYDAMHVAHTDDPIGAANLTRSYSCGYTAQWEEKAMTCVLGAKGTLSMTVPTARVLKTNSWDSPFKSKRTVANCKTGSKQLDVKAKVKDFGRYTFSGALTKINCTVKHYTKADSKTKVLPPDAIASCGSPYADTKGNKWQFDCTGFRQGWTSKTPSWDADACKGDEKKTTGTWSCTVPGNNTIAGVSIKDGATATFYRDGESLPVVFGGSKPKGKSIVSSTGSTTQVFRDKDSTPWANALPATRNFFEVTRGSSSVMTTKAKTRAISGTVPGGWNVAGVWVSEQGKPTVLTARYTFAIRYTVETVTIKSIDLETAIATITPTTRTVDTTGTCDADPLSINFVRGVTAQ